MESSYDICFAGETLEGQTLSAVKLNLARLFKADEATLEKLFSGKVQVLKRGCDRETALKYKSAMEKAGAKPIVRDNAEAQASTGAAKAREGGGSAAERIDLAPVGSDVLRPEERAVETSSEIDTSSIELLESGVDLSDGGGEAPPPPDISHLSMGEVGEDIPTLPSTAKLLSPDISAISLSPEDTDFSDCAPPPAVAADVDLSALDLAPSGADMLDAAYRPNRDTKAPSTEHLRLEDENGS